MDELLDDLLNLGKECTTPQYDVVLNKIKKHSDCTPELLQGILSCVDRGDNWLFAGADFSALEAKIGAILSQDPNKIKVYVEGYCSHSLNALAYFSDQMPDITASIDKAETATKFWIDDKGDFHCE